jgi:hypothetical protein
VTQEPNFFFIQPENSFRRMFPDRRPDVNNMIASTVAGAIVLRLLVNRKEKKYTFHL